MKITQPDSELTIPNTPADHLPSPSLTIECDEQNVLADYANFCRISGTPEEVLLDFGLHSMAIPNGKIKVSHRVIVGWHTAKRLLQALQVTLERNENVFGVLETDVQQRFMHKDVGRCD